MIETTIFAPEFNEEHLQQLSDRGRQMIDALRMQPPIRCTLFDRSGAKLRSFEIGQPLDADQCYCGDEEIWSRSAKGVTLQIEDRDGRAVQVTLHVGRLQ